MPGVREQIPFWEHKFKAEMSVCLLSPGILSGVQRDLSIRGFSPDIYLLKFK
jgi:hypothetical protein